MPEPQNIGEAVKHTLNALFDSFAQQRYQEGADFLATLHPETTSVFERMLQGLQQGTPDAFAQLQRILDLPGATIAAQVAQRYAHLPPEQQEKLTTFLCHYESMEDAAREWFCTIEGHACSADRSRTLRRMLFRYFAEGTLPEPNYGQEYTYHLSSGSLVSAQEILTWYQRFLCLQRGELVPYALELSEGMTRYQRRKHQTDLPIERTPPWDAALAGKPTFVIQAAMQHHTAGYPDPALRILVLQFSGDFHELSSFIHAKAKAPWRNTLMAWALTARPIQIPRSLRKYFNQPDDVIHYLKARLAAMQGEKDGYKAAMQRFHQIKSGTSHD